MKLSLETVTGLKRLCNETLIPKGSFEDLLEKSSKAVFHNTVVRKESKENVKVDIMKTALASLTVLFTEGARHNIDTIMMEIILEGYNLDSKRIIAVTDAYTKYRNLAQNQLLVIGTNAPHIIEVYWKMDYAIKADNKKCYLEPIFYIDLVTVSSNNLRKTVRFAATVQNLEELVFQLKGAVRHINKLGYMLK